MDLGRFACFMLDELFWRQSRHFFFPREIPGVFINSYWCSSKEEPPRIGGNPTFLPAKLKTQSVVPGSGLIHCVALENPLNLPRLSILICKLRMIMTFSHRDAGNIIVECVKMLFKSEGVLL